MEDQDSPPGKQSQSDPLPAGALHNAHQLLSLLGASSETEDSINSRSRIISTAQSLLPYLDDDNDARAKMLEALADALYNHFEAVNEWHALETAIDYLGELIEDTDDGDIQKTARLSYSYSRCLRSRYARGGNPTDLENAIEFASLSIDRTAQVEGNKDGKDDLLSARRSNLWLCLFTKVHKLDDCPDDILDQMMNVAENTENALLDLNVGRGSLAEAKSNLSLSYQIRWERKSSFEDLERSLCLGYDTINLLSTEKNMDARVNATSNLAFQLQRAYLCYVIDKKLPRVSKITCGEDLLREAFKNINESMSIQNDRKLSKLENALAFVMYIADFPKHLRPEMLGKCHGFLRHSTEILRNVCLTSSREDQQDSLSTFYGISRYAAAATLQAEEDPYEALQMLEEGRGVTMSSQFETLNEITELSAIDQDLAARYVAAREGVTAAFTNEVPFHERIACQNCMEEIRNEILATPGLSCPPGVLDKDATLRLSDQGDIVVINITDLRSDAIIVSKGKVRVAHLPGLDETKVSEMSWQIQTYLAKDRDQETVFASLQKALTEFLRELWKHLVRPVLDDLGYSKRPGPSESWPRIWWIPTGVLSLYPIHAAGMGLDREANTMNRVVSSYALSLKALSLARGREEMRKIDSKKVSGELSEIPGAAIITMRDTPGRQPLELSEEEAEVIIRCFSNSQVLHQPLTQDALAFIAQGQDIVHISCHGETDYDRPSKSTLLMADWEKNPLIVSDLQMLDVRKSCLAFLSACFTANAGVENLQDEVTHVAGALQLAGFPNVIGSLWYVGQEAALAVAARFYERLVQRQELGSACIAEALHLAVLDFREATRSAGNRMKGNPVSWAPFVHLGA